MTKKQKKVPVVNETEESRDVRAARLGTKPYCQAATTIVDYNKTFGDLNFIYVSNQLHDQIGSIQDGNLKDAESMLFSQAVALESIFHNLSRRAIGNLGNRESFECLLRMGLKAQSQSRATLETLGKLKNPQPVAFVRQANISNGPQQVNNMDSTLARENISPPNEVLEDQNGTRMDTRASCSTIPANSELETVGSIHRPDN